MNDTPRTDAAYAASTGAGIYELFKESQELERELNAATYESQHLREAYIQLREGAEESRQRIKRLEEAGNNLLWNFCPEYTSDLTQEQSDALKQWNKAKEAKP